MLRVTRNCPWRRCTFCYANFYGHANFELRPLVDIKADIQAMASISNAVREESWRLGHGGAIDDILAAQLVQQNPLLQRHAGFVTLFNWLLSGGHTAFLQDADSLIMRPGELEEAILSLRTTFPSLQRITSYARAKTVFRKSQEQLKGLREAGLSRLHIGLETGDDELLKLVDKGITSEQHIEAGRKAKQAGFQLSLYIMPDLGGTALWRQHAENTARVLSKIDPDYVRSRPFIPREGTPMYDDYTAGKLQISSPHERLRELRLLVENLTLTSRLCFDHFGNSWRGRSGSPLFKRDYEGYKFPEEKQQVLELIEEGLALDESHHVHARDIVGITHL